MKLELKKKILFWYVVVKGKNGETLLVSETYYSKGNAQRALTKLKKEMKIK